MTTLKRKTVTTQGGPPPVELTIEQQRERAYDFTESRLGRQVEDGVTAQAELAVKVATDASSAVSWAEAKIIDIELGLLAARVLAIAEALAKPGQNREVSLIPYAALVRACESVLGDLTGDLLHNRLRASSTSAFSNAVEGARREAYAQMITQCHLALGWLKQPSIVTLERLVNAGANDVPLGKAGAA